MTNGILVLDKPLGPTSFDMVRWLRTALKIKRVGHTGTLDPMASGILVICVGEATKLVPYLMDAEKEYEATIRLGITTDTDDAAPESKILHTVPPQNVLLIKEELISEVIQSFIGKRVQIPPQFSALKYKGKPLYDLARQAQTAEERMDLQDKILDKKREISIHQILVHEVQLPFITMKIICSKGTYIRSLAREIGEKLGVGAHLSQLRRTRVGTFSLAQATDYGLQDQSIVLAQHQKWISLTQAVDYLPQLLLTKIETDHIRKGKATELALLIDRHQVQLNEALKQEQPVALVSEKSDLIAILVYEQNRWKIGRGFYSSC